MKLASLVRGFIDGAAVVPRGETAFQNNDTVLALAALADELHLRKLLLG